MRLTFRARRGKDSSTVSQVVQRLRESYEARAMSELRVEMDRLRRLLADDRADERALTKVLAIAAESARRHLGQVPRDNQVQVAWWMVRGGIVELPTGEGKTLAAALAASTLAAAGNSVHVLTVNDFLADRDSSWMRPLFEGLDLLVSAIGAGDVDAVRRAKYQSDVTYATHLQVGFDHLRDGLVICADQRRIHRFESVIVDEADSILIDEARLPLVISGPGDPAGDLPYRATQAVERLAPFGDYVVEHARRRVWLTDAGVDRVSSELGVHVYDDPELLRHVDHALRARTLFGRDRDYVVVGEEVRLVDAYTGRTVHGRRWSDGLHQAIEAKERRPLSLPRVTYAQMTVRSLIQLYPHLAGMTGTAREVARELRDVYGAETFMVPPHCPSVRVDHPDQLFDNLDEKLDAVVEEVSRRHQRGQPLLVGCSTVKACEAISTLLGDAGISHETLHARDHSREAEIMALAGRLGAVTVATHLSGRGVDIRLGGPHAQDTDLVRDGGGLCVVGTERYESQRIERQLRGRAGRQGDPGESIFFCSPGDASVAPWTPSSSRVSIRERMMISQRNLEEWNRALRDDLLAFDRVFEHHRRAARGVRDELLGSRALLEAHDRKWVQHLQDLYALLDGIHFRAWGAQSPLAAFHIEARILLDQLLAATANAPRDPDDSLEPASSTPTPIMRAADLGPRAPEEELPTTGSPPVGRSVAGHQPLFGMGVLLDVIAVADVDGGSALD